MTTAAQTVFPRKKWHMRERTRRAMWGYIFILPAMIFFTIWVVLPLFTAVGMSFTNYNTATAQFVGLKNYLTIFQKPDTAVAIKNTVQFALELIPLNIIISLVLALLVDQKLRGVVFFRTAYYLPVLTSLVVAGIVWSALYDYRAGPINAILGWFGLPAQQWLTNSKLALSSVVMVRVWKGVGFNMMVFLAGLQGIPTELYEAAMMDGVKGLQKIRYITIPMLRPTTFYIFVMACISSFQVFGEIYVMTKGGPAGSTKTLIFLIWEQAFEYSNLGYASALAVVLLVLIGTIAVFNLVYVNRLVDYEQ